jgi:tryptophan 2,3-dioxygenase
MADKQPSVSYGDYLALDELLELQRPRSTPEHPDELLFIVVHQSSELWFKVIIQQLHAVAEQLEKGDAELALWHVQRLNTLMRIVAEQLSSLDTLPPQRFQQFRDFLGASSGQQSSQFKEIVTLSAPKLEEHFLELVADSGKTLEWLYTGPGPERMFFLAEALLEYDQAFQRWRFLHVQLVERIIGPMTKGTGGSMGAGYLAQSVNSRFFPALWDVRGRLFNAK